MRVSILRHQFGAISDLQGEFPVDDAGLEETTDVFGLTTELSFSPDAPAVAKPPCSWTQITQADRELSLSRPLGTPWVAIAMVFGLLLWTAATVGPVRQSLSYPTTPNILLDVVMVLGDLFLAFMIPYMLFGRESLTLTDDSLHFERKVLIPLKVVNLPLSSVQILRMARELDLRNKNRINVFSLVIETTGKPIRFAWNSTEEEIRWLADLIQRHIWKYAPKVGLSADRFLGRLGQPQSSREILRPQELPLPRPAGTGVRLERQINRTTIWRRTPAKSLVAITLFTAFSNGLLVFGLEKLLFTDSRIDFVAVVSAIVLLFPLAIFGLLLLLFWMMSVGGFIAGTEWVFEPGRVGQKFCILGLGRGRWQSLPECPRIEIRPWTVLPKKRKANQRRERRRLDRLAVGVVEGDRDIATLGPFTSAEAAWIADALLHDFRNWQMVS